MGRGVTVAADKILSRHEIVTALVDRDGNRCFFCKRALAIPEITIDHYIPQSKGGSWDLENLRASCLPCNNDKADRVPLDEHGTLPPKVSRPPKNSKKTRPEVCWECGSGRYLDQDETCWSCGSDPMPIVRPQHLKRKVFECDHDINWCIGCCLLTNTERREYHRTRIAL